jgi:hypothetical protein
MQFIFISSRLIVEMGEEETRIRLRGRRDHTEMSGQRRQQHVKNGPGLIFVSMMRPIDIRCSKAEWARFRQHVRENRTDIVAGRPVGATTRDDGTAMASAASGLTAESKSGRWPMMPWIADESSVEWIEDFSSISEEELTGCRHLEAIDEDASLAFVQNFEDFEL